MNILARVENFRDLKLVVMASSVAGLIVSLDAAGASAASFSFLEPAWNTSTETIRRQGDVDQIAALFTPLPSQTDLKTNTFRTSARAQAVTRVNTDINNDSIAEVQLSFSRDLRLEEAKSWELTLEGILRGLLTTDEDAEAGITAGATVLRLTDFAGERLETPVLDLEFSIPFRGRNNSVSATDRFLIGSGSSGRRADIEAFAKSSATFENGDYRIRGLINSRAKIDNMVFGEDRARSLFFDDNRFFQFTLEAKANPVHVPEPSSIIGLFIVLGISFVFNKRRLT